jgi:hypothetical protein
MRKKIKTLIETSFVISPKDSYDKIKGYKKWLRLL